MVYTLKAVYTVLFDESIDWLLLQPDVTSKYPVDAINYHFHAFLKINIKHLPYKL